MESARSIKKPEEQGSGSRRAFTQIQIPPPPRNDPKKIKRRAVLSRPAAALHPFLFLNGGQTSAGHLRKYSDFTFSSGSLLSARRFRQAVLGH
jgi:hypothetical protein